MQDAAAINRMRANPVCENVPGGTAQRAARTSHHDSSSGGGLQYAHAAANATTAIQGVHRALVKTGARQIRNAMMSQLPVTGYRLTVLSRFSARSSRITVPVPLSRAAFIVEGAVALIQRNRLLLSAVLACLPGKIARFATPLTVIGMQVLHQWVPCVTAHLSATFTAKCPGCGARKVGLLASTFASLAHVIEAFCSQGNV